MLHFLIVYFITLSFYITIFQAITEGILTFALKDCLGKQQRVSFFKLLQALSQILAPNITQDEANKLAENINLDLALVERDFPISVQVSH